MTPNPDPPDGMAAIIRLTIYAVADPTALVLSVGMPDELPPLDVVDAALRVVQESIPSILVQVREAQEAAVAETN